MSRALRLWPALAVLLAAAFGALAYGVLGGGRVRDVLLRTGGDRELRQALVLVDAATRPGLSPGAAFRERGVAAAALAQARQSGPAAERARASHLIAVLALKDAAVDRANAQQYVATARDGFSAAIRLDPHDDASKYDLELLLSLDRKRQGKRGASGHGHKGSARGATQTRAGTGASPPGRGY